MCVLLFWLHVPRGGIAIGHSAATRNPRCMKLWFLEGVHLIGKHSPANPAGRFTRLPELMFLLGRPFEWKVRGFKFLLLSTQDLSYPPSN